MDILFFILYLTSSFKVSSLIKKINTRKYFCICYILKKIFFYKNKTESAEKPVFYLLAYEILIKTACRKEYAYLLLKWLPRLIFIYVFAFRMQSEYDF